MAARLEVRHNDRIIYSQDVDDYSIDVQDGTLTLAAIETDPTATVTADDAPVSQAAAPDAHLVEEAGTDPTVLEQVHTGDAYTQLPSATVTVDGVDMGPGEVGSRPDDAHPGTPITDEDDTEQ